MKYGITLDNAHYISTSGDTLWNAKTDIEHYNRIKGLASDSVYGLYSAFSNSLEDSTLYITSPLPLPIGSYVLIGDDNNTIEWLVYNDTLTMLQRSWKLRSDTNITSILIELNQKCLPYVIGIPALAVINNDYEIIKIIRSDSVNSNNHLCYTISQLSRQMIFTFIDSCYAQSQSQQGKIRKSPSDNHADNSNPGNDISVVHHSANGDFTLDISLSEQKDIFILIQDPSGKSIAKQYLTGVDNYQYNSYLPVGVYIVSVYAADNKLLATQELIIQ